MYQTDSQAFKPTYKVATLLTNIVVRKRDIMEVPVFDESNSASKTNYSINCTNKQTDARTNTKDLLYRGKRVVMGYPIVYKSNFT